MTRFAPNGVRIAYQPQQSEKPFKQMVGLYNMWQSLSPETRNLVANWFTSPGDVVPAAYNQALDTQATYYDIPEFGSDVLADRITGALTGVSEGIDKVGDNAMLSWDITDMNDRTPREERLRKFRNSLDRSTDFNYQNPERWLWE